MRRIFVTKKLLVASIGVASVSYAACTKEPAPQPLAGNLMAPAAVDAAPPPTVSPLPPTTTSPPPHPIVGNLMPMPMPDALDAGGRKKL